MTTPLTLTSDTTHPNVLSPNLRRRGFAPIVLAMMAQGVGMLVTLTVLWLLPAAVGALLPALCHGAVAAAAGRCLRLANWWMPINFIFVPAALLCTGAAFEAQWFLVAFLALVLVYWSAYRTQVPLYLTSGAGCKVVEEILAREAPHRFLDMGSGSGSVLSRVTRRFPHLQCDGVELAPLPFWISRLRLLARQNCRVRWRDLWSVDLTQYDVVYAYLSPAPMSALWEKVKREMRPGTLFVSNSFPVVGITPQEIVVVPGPIKRKLYLWRM